MFFSPSLVFEVLSIVKERPAKEQPPCQIFQKLEPPPHRGAIPCVYVRGGPEQFGTFLKCTGQLAWAIFGRRRTCKGKERVSLLMVIP